MSSAGGNGSALDVTARIAELGDRPEVVALDNERMALHHALYMELVNDTSTAVYAAHVAQLERLYGNALRGLGSAATAKIRAIEQMQGAEDAERSAVVACDSAELALAEVAGPEAVDAVRKSVR